MRIVHLVHQYLPEYVGGTELYTQALAYGLTARGHDVAVCYRCSGKGQGHSERDEDGVDVWAMWDGAVTPRSRFLASFRLSSMVQTFEHLLDTVQPDIVHIQHLMGLPLALLRVIAARQIPYVVTLHDYWWVCANAQLLTNYDETICDGPRAYLNCARCALVRAGAGALYPAIPALAGLMTWRNRRLRAILLEAASIIAPSAFVRRWYASAFSHSDIVQRVTVIPHGIEPPLSVDQTPYLDLHQGPRRVAYIGGLTQQKGVHIVVEAFREMEGATELWIAGDETADPDYIHRLRTLAASNVRFLGKLSRAEVWNTLAQVDVVVVPSLWYETFSLIVREAFAASVPVIVSDLGALAEAVRDGVDGLRVPPGDVVAWRTALHRLLASPGLRSQLRANIRQPLTLSEHISRIETLYEGVIPREMRR